MTMRPPVFVDGVQVAGVDLRLALSGLLTTSGPLVARAGSLGAPVLVRASDTPAMNVVVPVFVYSTPGAGFGSGAVPAVNDGPLTLVVPASSATNPRVDVVVVRHAAETVVAGLRGSFCEYIAGTAAPSPVAPAVPTNGQLLATIAVPVSAASITNAMITNTRAQTSAAGGITVSRTSADVVGTYAGQYRHRSDTSNLEYWTGVTWTAARSGATTPISPTSYSPFTDPSYGGITVYRDGDGWVHIGGGVTSPVSFTPGNANPFLVFDLPVGLRPTQERFFNAPVMLGPGAPVERAVMDISILANGQFIFRGCSTPTRQVTAASVMSFEGLSYPT